MNILIATGGSGGHVFPAIETAKVLRRRGHQVSFAGVLGVAEGQIKDLNFPVYPLAGRGLINSSGGEKLRFSMAMAMAVLRASSVVWRVKPDKIIGFGGYGSVAVVLAGYLRKYPAMVHEQNLVPGKANAFLAKIVKQVAVSFQSSLEFFPAAPKVVWTGCPCHQQSVASRAESLNVFGLQEDKKTLLLLGGSQGSRKLNEVFFDCMGEWAASGHIQAIHMTGPSDYALYKEKYKQAGWPVKVYAFIHAIEQAYAVTDLAIARAGAATVSELGAMGIAAVLVPYPFADGHQKFNAQVLADAGVALMIEEGMLDKEALKQAVNRLMDQDLTRTAVLQKTDGLFQKDAALQLAIAVEGL